MSAFARPLLTAPDGQTHLLERIPLQAGAGNQISERWLQEQLFAAPQSLPIRELDFQAGQLIPICMELETGAGPADILYVTCAGKIVIVETKLWRNPEARREVVGQILDYAKQLTSWTFETLDQRAALACKAKAGHLINCLKARDPGADEVVFVDGINRSLASGDFLLLIVGDGIRSGAEALFSFLERFGNLKFSLGLVEVAAFRLPDGSTLLQPRVLARTEVVQRTVLLGPNGPLSFQEAALAEDIAADTNQGMRDWFASFWSEFLLELRRHDPTLGQAEPAKTTNQYFPMPPSGSKAWISTYTAQSRGEAGVYLTFARAFDQAQDLHAALLADREAIEREVGTALSWSDPGEKPQVTAPKIAYTDLKSMPDRQRVIAYLAEMTNKLVLAIKPRLQAALRGDS